MARSDLQRWLTELPGFRRRLTAVVIDSVASQFPDLVRPPSLPEPLHEWPYLLLCASTLAGAENERSEDAALRIAQHCLSSSDTLPEQRDAAAVILDSLTNKPAIRLAERRELLEARFTDRLPGPLLQDYVRRALQYRVVLGTGEIIEANRFQHQFWSMTQDAEWLSVSAPTSAGKSYILKKWLEDHIRVNGPVSVVYIVPTRALIQEVEEDLRQYFRDSLLRNVVVSSVPSEAMMRQGASHVFVFTQERLHLLMTRVAATFRPDILLVDEAQKIGDGHRGVLLQQVLDDVVRQNPQVKVVFASPLTSNPEVLLADAPVGRRTQRLASEEVTVNQNLLWVSQLPGTPKRWQLDLRVDGEGHQLGTVQLPNSPGHLSKRLTFIAHAMSRGGGGNLVYVNTAADAEKAALQLWDLVGEQGIIARQQDVSDLIELVRDTIHPKYVLIKVLKRGVAFHYGNMPLLVRKEIEHLFRDGVLRYLVCTSTLLEGVNLPCRSVYARGPRKGKTQPMSPSDFWNLAGRAGRWGKEFQGNVVCIDPKVEVWREGVPERRVKQKIATTAERIHAKASELADFVNSGTPRAIASKNPDLEYLASYLAASRIRYGTLLEAPIGVRIGVSVAARLEHAFQVGFVDLDVPEQIVMRNPGISPLAMRSLLRYFREREKPPVELVPVPPESSDAAQVYTAVFHRINSHLSLAFGTGGRVFQCAVLVVNWMRGYSLARLISSWVSYLDQKGRQYRIASEIRRTMEDVETIARYRAPKYLSCYLDLLTYHFEHSGQAELLKEIPNLSVLLEFGVSQKTQISLMSLGLSRTATIAVSELIAKDNLDISEAIAWLQAQDWESVDLPALTKRDIQRAIELALPQ